MARSKSLYARIGSLPFRGDFEITSGDSMSLVVTVVDDTDAAVNITGYSASWKVADGPTDDAEIKKSVGSGITLTTPASGILTIAIAASNTSDMAGIYYHELQLTDGSSNVSTALYGRLSIKADVS